MTEITPESCGYALTDSDGEQYPCDQPATGWRWYQDVGEHEDMLDAACEHHANAGGALIAAARTAWAEVERLSIVVDEARKTAEADRDHWQARALAAEERVDGQAWEELTAEAQRLRDGIAAALEPCGCRWERCSCVDDELRALLGPGDGGGSRKPEPTLPDSGRREGRRLREGIGALADEYDERSRDTEGAERYPWGVAADDLRALLESSDGSGA